MPYDDEQNVPSNGKKKKKNYGRHSERKLCVGSSDVLTTAI